VAFEVLTVALRLLSFSGAQLAASERRVDFLGGGSMLPPFIIEQIQIREERRKRGRYDQPRLELPLEAPRPRLPASPEDEPSHVVIVEIF
jgi:hypothetical protein